jgi:hypothetical protein
MCFNQSLTCYNIKNKGWMAAQCLEPVFFITVDNNESCSKKDNGDSLEVCKELCSIVLFQLSFKQGKKLMNGLVRIEENLTVQKTRRSKAY